jgi:hypothetical protein
MVISFLFIYMAKRIPKKREEQLREGWDKKWNEQALRDRIYCRARSVPFFLKYFRIFFSQT